MAVHDQSYHPYRGPLTSPAARFLVLPRYCLREIFRPRLFTAQITSSLALPLAAAIFIYVRHNLSLLKSLPFPLPALMPVDATFFAGFIWFQSLLAFLLTIVVMPALISPDLVNGALPLYLSHPLSRRAYLAGKLATLLSLLSAITWIPGAALFFLEAALGDGGWGWDHRRLLFGTVGSFALAILAMALPGVAVSVHQRSKARARAALVTLVFVAAATGGMMNGALGTHRASVLMAPAVLDAIVQAALGSKAATDVTPEAALAMVAAVCLTSLLVIVRRLKAVEVVR